MLRHDGHVRIKLAPYGRQGAPSIFLKSSDSTHPVIFSREGPFQQTNAIASGAHLLKLTPDVQHVLYYTYLSSQRPTGLGVNSDGTSVVNVSADPGSIPLKNAFQPSLQGSSNDSFISKVSATGEWVFSAYFGNSGGAACSGAAIGTAGSLVFTGSGGSFRFKNAPQTQSNPGSIGDRFRVMMAPDGQSLLLSTFIGEEDFTGIGMPPYFNNLTAFMRTLLESALVQELSGCWSCQGERSIDW